MKRIDLFTSSGTWVCPAGVTYAIAHIRGGGGGGGGSRNVSLSYGGTGGSSSALGFTGGGGAGGSRGGLDGDMPYAGVDGPNNSGNGGTGCGTSNVTNANGTQGHSTAILVAGTEVTVGVEYPIVIGAGGAGGIPGSSGGKAGGVGGSGAVWIEYEVPA